MSGFEVAAAAVKGITMAQVGTAAAVGGMAMSAGGMMMQARHAQQAHEYNAALAAQQMKVQETKGRIAQDAITSKQQRLMATQRAKYGASGVTMEGSPLLVMADSWTEFERDKAIASFDADIGLSQAQSRMSMHKMQGSQAMQAGAIGAGSSLLTGSYDLGVKQGWWGK